jgi:hypothetical protein
MSKLVLEAIVAEATAKESKALANLDIYMRNAAGIGEHPDSVAECSKLVKDIAEARELKETVKSLIETSVKLNKSK